MRFYHVSAAIDGAPYTATLEEAKRIARNAAANSYQDVVVELSRSQPMRKTSCAYLTMRLVRT